MQEKRPACNSLLQALSDIVGGMGQLDGKVAIVTGGAQGIGKAIAEGLARETATVVTVDLNPPPGGIRADVSSEEDVTRMVEETLQRHGRIDILVNNAGLYASLAMRPFTEIPLEEWRQVMDVNVASMFLTSRAVVPVMREQGGGKIVNISSGTPFRGVPFLLHYVTSKGAIVALTRALAKELGKDGIHVNCVAPGFTMSDGVMAHPEVIEKLRDASVAARTIQRDQLPEDVVGAVVFLCSPGGGLRHRPDDGHRRRPVLPLILVFEEHPEGVVTTDGNHVVYDLATNQAHFGAARVEGPAVVWKLAEDPGPGEWLLRCDRVDFPPGGVAYRHVHPGPGIRRLLHGELTIARDTGAHTYRAGESWFEDADDPVVATASPTRGHGVRARSASPS